MFSHTFYSWSWNSSCFNPLFNCAQNTTIIWLYSLDSFSLVLVYLGSLRFRRWFVVGLCSRVLSIHELSHIYVGVRNFCLGFDKSHRLRKSRSIRKFSYLRWALKRIVHCEGSVDNVCVAAFYELILLNFIWANLFIRFFNGRTLGYHLWLIR
jgi:hypothetical protein